MADRIQHARDTEANWASVNPVLLEGEMGIITDRQGLFKIGDGRTRWSNLPLYGGKDNFVESTDADISQMINNGTWVSGTIYYTTED